MLGLGNTVSSGSVPESKYSLTFDGNDDYLDLGTGISLGTGDFTISAWVKTADFHNTFIISEYVDAENRWYIRGGDGDPPRLQMYQEIGDTSHSTYTGSSISLDDHKNVWTHIVISADRDGKVVGYINGVADTADKNGEATSLTTTASTNIAKYASTYSDFQMGDVAIWNVALDADAVTAIYNSGKPIDLTFDSGNYDNSSALQGYWRMGNGSFDDKINGAIHDQHNPGFGAELIPNNDFSANEAESQANLVGGVQFDNWVENPGTGKRAFSVIENGFRSTCVEASDSSWQQRVSQDLHSILTVGDVYRFNCDYLTSDGSSIRVAIQTPGSSDIQIGGTQSTSAGVKYTLNGYFTCSATTNIDVDLWPTAVQSAGEYFEISNVSLKKLNGFPGLTSGGPTFSSDTP